MSSSSVICLSAEEVESLTGRKRPTAQARALVAAGIPFRTRHDGTLIVLRIHAQYETQEKEPASPAVCPP
jgi:hypothetical protein